jgi:hypothetical protein
MALGSGRCGAGAGVEKVSQLLRDSGFPTAQEQVLNT